MTYPNDNLSCRLIRDIVENYRDSPEILFEIFSIFLDEVPAKLDALQAAADIGDLDRVRSLAHSLANTTGTLRVQSSLRLARETESAARAGEMDIVRDRAARLIVGVREIVTEIRQFTVLVGTQL
jgi:HPt (histidine-containing phosphotransfer) domain-containing protein